MAGESLGSTAAKVLRSASQVSRSRCSFAFSAATGGLASSIAARRARRLKTSRGPNSASRAERMPSAAIRVAGLALARLLRLEPGGEIAGAAANVRAAHFRGGGAKDGEVLLAAGASAFCRSHSSPARDALSPPPSRRHLGPLRAASRDARPRRAGAKVVGTDRVELFCSALQRRRCEEIETQLRIAGAGEVG